MADTRIRVKLGQIEIEYEGAASFLEKDLVATVKQLLELQGAHPAAAPKAPAGAGGGSAAPTAGQQFSHSTDTIASILEANSGTDLIIAAAAHLHFVKGQPTFTRQEIVDEMRAATSHFKASYPNNLSSYLQALTTKGRLRLTGKDTYALSRPEARDVEAKLAAAE